MYVIQVICTGITSSVPITSTSTVTVTVSDSDSEMNTSGIRVLYRDRLGWTRHVPLARYHRVRVIMMRDVSPGWPGGGRDLLITSETSLAKLSPLLLNPQLLQPELLASGFHLEFV
jgi:hypothetical protein